MNIFYLSYDIEENVRFHCDKHVVKMILESAQMLCAIQHLTGNPDVPYKLTHKNHPCTLWAMSSIENYAYLYSLAVLLGEEYTYRYGRVHKSISVVEALRIPSLPDIPFSHPPKCVHDDFKNVPDVVEAYRAYYIRDKGDFCRWTRREVPGWFKNSNLNLG